MAIKPILFNGEMVRAKDFKNYPNIKIHIPKGGKFEMVEHEEGKKCDG